MNPETVAFYVDDAPRKVPGLADLHRMAILLLAEQALAAARIEIYEKLAHGMCTTHAEIINPDLLDFIRA